MPDAGDREYSNPGYVMQSECRATRTELGGKIDKVLDKLDTQSIAISEIREKQVEHKAWHNGQEKAETTRRAATVGAVKISAAIFGALVTIGGLIWALARMVAV